MPYSISFPLNLDLSCDLFWHRKYSVGYIVTLLNLSLTGHDMFPFILLEPWASTQVQPASSHYSHYSQSAKVPHIWMKCLGHSGSVVKVNSTRSGIDVSCFAKISRRCWSLAKLWNCQWTVLLCIRAPLSFRVVCIRSCISFTDSNEADDCTWPWWDSCRALTAGAGYVIGYS